MPLKDWGMLGFEDEFSMTRIERHRVDVAFSSTCRVSPALELLREVAPLNHQRVIKLPRTIEKEVTRPAPFPRRR